MDHFTTVIRQPISCLYCPTAACRQCTSNYLLQTLNDPHCFGCKREWNREFIDTKLTQTFRKGALRQHRRKVLIDREKGRLPAMQIYVEARKDYQANYTLYLDCYAKRRQLKKERNAIQVLHAATDTPEQLIERLRPLNTQRSELKSRGHQAHLKMLEANEILTGKKREVRQFVMKCPAEECRGFLSTAWKCGTCLKFFCAECHAEKASSTDETHTCNPDAKATAAMIKQETRPCPKCGIRISKIDGCFAKDTPILCWDGHSSKAQEIKVGDILVGDDGAPRVVEELCSGGDEMFEVTQGKGMTYTVNSKHKLALKFSGEKSIHWSESEEAWCVRWFDRAEHCIKSKKSRVTEQTDKEESYTLLDAFCQSLDFDEVIELTVDEYVRVPESVKKHLMGFKSQGIQWDSKSVSLDPYLMGLWLGDGINDGMSFAVNPEADPEILQFLLDWCDQNNAEVVHDEAYRFRIRRREVAFGRLAIAHGASCDECKGCKEKKCKLCDLPEKPYTEDHVAGLRHPLKESLDLFDLPRNSKYIPHDYLINSRQIRLQLLAGLIDTDGYVGNDGKRVMISQANHTLGKQIEFLAKSLGFAVHVDLVKKHQVSFPNVAQKRDYPDHYRVTISGEHLSEIPTRVARKKCLDSNSTKDELRTSISVKSVGQGTYYGWSVSGSNRRFLLADFTVARNCDQMWCTSCQTTFSWNTGQMLQNTVVHNPHYYEYLRQRNNGVVPREAGDVPCGGLPNAYTFTRDVMAFPVLTLVQKTELLDIVRFLSDLQYVRLPQYPLRQPAEVNREVDIQFLMNEIDETQWGTALEQIETKAEQKKEIGLILQTLLHVGSEKLTLLQNESHGRRGPARSEIPALALATLKEMNEVRVYTNKCLIAKGNQMGIVVPQIPSDWIWLRIRKADMKKGVEEDVPGEVPIPAPLPALPSLPPETMEASPEEEDTVLVEIGGEILEMTRIQARQILAQGV
jgi:hypothetical protein